MTTPIPPRIIQTAKSADLPLAARGIATNLKLLHPGWEYAFFDNPAVERFIDAEFPQYRAVFDAFPVRIQRYDFFRYLAVYKLGGFYFDTDVLLAKPLDDLRDKACVFPFEELTVHRFLIERYDMDWEIGNYAFGAAPGHPFVKSIIDNCVRAQREPAWAEEMMAPVPGMFRDEFFVYDTTGPGLVSRTLAEYAEDASEPTVLFPPDVRDYSTWHCFGDYGVHLQDGTWRPRRSFLHSRLFRLWEARERRQLNAESARRGPSRARRAGKVAI